MPFSLRHARRLLRSLPADPEMLLKRRKYADPGFCNLLLEYLDGKIFHSPNLALPWAMVAPDLALATAERVGPNGGQEHQELLARSWSVLGSANRGCGRYDASESAYEQAAELAHTVAFPEATRAHIAIGLGNLRVAQNRPKDALEISAEELARVQRLAANPTSRRSANLAFALRGLVLNKTKRYPEAIINFGQVLRQCHPKDSPLSDRCHLAAANNLLLNVAKAKEPSDKWAALRYVREAREASKGAPFRNVERYRLQWAEGFIWAQVGLHARAEKAYRIALEGFDFLGLPWQSAIVAIDLGAIHHLAGEWHELESLARSIYQRFRVLSGNTKALTVLSRWVSAISSRTLTDEVLFETRWVICAGLVKDSQRTGKGK